MFIELTDHLRCMADHDEAFLVLLPDQMEGREVRSGHIGCPVCGWSGGIASGELDFGGGTPATGATGLTPDAVAALLGLGGPGGFVTLAGAATRLAPGLAPLLEGIHLVAVNPPADLDPTTGVSRLHAGRLPLRSASMRGVVLGGDLGGDLTWVADAVRAVLPGLRVIAEGGGAPPGVEVLAEAGGVLVLGKARV